jgi:hypothetical protein
MALSTVALVAGGLGAAGALVSGISQVGQMRQQAAIADANAENAEQEGQAQADLIRDRARRLRSSNIAAIGASGVDISGSFADALEDSDIEAELDAQTTVRNAKMQANNYRAEGRASRSGIAPVAIGTALGAGSQALSGYGNWRLLKTLKPDEYPIGTVNPNTGMFGHI